MGAAASKLTDDIKEDSSESTRPSAPILTPQIRRLNLDPRSPSSDIARTPIEVLKTPISGSSVTTTDNSLNITEDVSDGSEHNTAPDTLLHLDPRSPTTEFHRTPIITDTVLKLQSIHNKNLDNARLSLVAVTPAKPRKVSEKVVKKIYGTPEIDSAKIGSPKLLGSSPVIVKSTENKRNSIVGLLETNIDFVETDLDVVIQNKILNNMKLSLEVNITESDVETSQSFLPNTENISKESDLNNTHELKQSDSESECEIPRSFETLSLTVDAYPLETKSDEFTGITQETYKISGAADPKHGLSANELDRKLTNLIYEDKQLESSPKPGNSVANHHTPLKDRNANSQQSRSIPTLKVSDKPTKLPGGISRIPVFKEKKVKGKVNVQCENTPPRMKPKHSEWAAEDSLII